MRVTKQWHGERGILPACWLGLVVMPAIRSHQDDHLNPQQFSSGCDYQCRVSLDTLGDGNEWHRGARHGECEYNTLVDGQSYSVAVTASALTVSGNTFTGNTTGSVLVQRPLDSPCCADCG